MTAMENESLGARLGHGAFMVLVKQGIHEAF